RSRAATRSRVVSTLDPCPTSNLSCLFLFFFSSRRRHTRLVSDWSSDVCSSDLASASRPHQRREDRGRLARVPQRRTQSPGGRLRSEERRVGKEGRSRWAPAPLKKKDPSGTRSRGESP